MLTIDHNGIDYSKTTVDGGTQVQVGFSWYVLATGFAKFLQMVAIFRGRQEIDYVTPVQEVVASPTRH